MRRKERVREELKHKREFQAHQRQLSRIALLKRILSLIILLLTIITLARFFFETSDKRRIRDLFSIIQYLAMSLILISPRLLKKYVNFEVPVEVHISVTIFAFLGLVLGDGLNWYGKIPWWDSVLHFASGVILSFIALWLMQMMVGAHKINYMNKILIYLFVGAFSLACGAFWELCEYSVDDIFKTNNQQYMASTRGTIISKDDIPLQGHAALADTMKDLVLDLDGALVVIGYECSKNGIKKKRNARKRKNA